MILKHKFKINLVIVPEFLLGKFLRSFNQIIKLRLYMYTNW